MKRIIRIICGCVLLFLCFSFLTNCSLLYGDKKLSSNNLSYFAHSIFKSCFVGDYTWPSDEQYAVLDIPDTCEGYRVTALGGYIGSGAPCPFRVNLPDVQYISSEEALPDHAEIEQYHLVINIGKNLRDDQFIVMDDFHCVDTNQFVQILVTVNCSADNPSFYSEDGKLYKRSDDSLVEGFFYYSDFN